MVISVNPEPNIPEFESLLTNTLTYLKDESRKKQSLYLGLLGNKLENKVFNVLNDCAKGTSFENSIELVSGQRFPDIVARKFYGVEVKTTKSNQWRSTGSSVAEGTRVDTVERIFMLFGKMSEPVEFMCKPYEDCLSEVVVTHSPRYLIDMNLKKGETIFDKIKTPYDTLRKQNDPIKTILNYYKSQLKNSGQTTWWSGDIEVGSNIIVRLWNSLDLKERNSYILKGFCLFPELLSKNQDKYNRLGLWLATKESIVCSSLRDLFSAGGQGEIEYNGQKYIGIPKIIINLTKKIEGIKATLNEIEIEVIEEYWECTVNSSNLFEKWCELVIPHLKKISPKNFPVEAYIKSI